MQIGTKTVQSIEIGNKTVQSIITSDGSYIYDRGEIDMTVVVIGTNNTIVKIKITVKGQPSSQSVYLRYYNNGSFTSSEIHTTSANGTTTFTLSGVPSIITAYTTINGNAISKQMTSNQYSYYLA